MSLNYERRYAYAEVDCILKWLGEEYLRKVPEKLIKTIKEEKKFGYNPQIDFTKPLTNQVRQETKNIIAYLNYNYWLKTPEEKQKLEVRINENVKKYKEKQKAERAKEIAQRAKMFNEGTVGSSIENALKNNSNN